MGKMLSEEWSSLRKLGIGYFLDSQPIKDFNMGELLESIRSIDASINKNPGVKIGYDKKYQHVSSFTTKEWKLNVDGSGKSRLGWKYHYLDNRLCKDFNDRRNFVPGNHSCHWLTFEAMSGFHVTITQVLRCEITNSWHKHKLNTGSKLIQQCPRIAHTFKITFKSLENFNENFENLRNCEEFNDCLNVTFSKNVLPKENTIKSDINDINIERSVTKSISTFI
ncbi:4066_t:CDS:2, partial [Diversispora eburnea]